MTCPKVQSTKNLRRGFFIADRNLKLECQPNILLQYPHCQGTVYHTPCRRTCGTLRCRRGEPHHDRAGSRILGWSIFVYGAPFEQRWSAILSDFLRVHAKSCGANTARILCMDIYICIYVYDMCAQVSWLTGVFSSSQLPAKRGLRKR